MPRAVAVTRLEQSRGDFESTVAMCQRTFGEPQPLAIPLGEDGSVTGTADLLRRRVREASAADPVERDPSEAEATLIEEQRGALIESVIEESEDESCSRGTSAGRTSTSRRWAPTCAPRSPRRGSSPSSPPTPPRHRRRGAARTHRAGVPVAGGRQHPRPSTPRSARTSARSPETRTAPSSRRSCAPRPTRTSDALAGPGVLGTRGPTRPCTSRGTSGSSSGAPRATTTTTATTSAGPLSAPVVDEMRPSACDRRGHRPRRQDQPGRDLDTLSGKDKPALVEPRPAGAVAAGRHPRGSKGDEDKPGSAPQRTVAEDVTMRLEHTAETHQVVLWARTPAMSTSSSPPSGTATTSRSRSNR